MPMENMVHMFGGTKKKSTLVDERVIYFPREDEGSPRQSILDKFCQADVKTFRNCMSLNNYDENKCLVTKGILDKCAASAFKKVNSEPEWIF
ncbi:UNKNOWN [Stylonychia lemnae]|uniref:IMS import disulfide relay-system CHCH-CHCH-like Cx9C domain-containing protein n=1 Tax=Stylonychia lemnae TaxID=5949 RepID=A0A077ZQA8_STYLE|nr:UNKNOWN [Stylonychia lemnae]|eukprot:CDW71580.1 UNKNOWN [Stylonychia lemnae]